MDIVLAVFLFGLTCSVLFLPALRNWNTWEAWFSLPVLTARLYFLGIPFAWVCRKWYFLMHELDPDYGQLWRTYWVAQALVIACGCGLAWFGLFIFSSLYASHNEHQQNVHG